MSKQDRSFVPGAIIEDAMYTMTELCARLGWGVNDLSVALDKGLRFYRFAEVSYVFGTDAMSFIKASGQTPQRSES